MLLTDFVIANSKLYNMAITVVEFQVHGCRIFFQSLDQVNMEKRYEMLHIVQNSIWKKKNQARDNVGKFHTYRKVVSSRLFWLVAHLRIFRLFMKGKFDAYVLRPLAKLIQNWIINQSTARDFTVLCWTGLLMGRAGQHAP